MSKLFTLRECLDVDDVARHLTGSFNETVTSKDVLNMVKEGKIPISVRFKFPVAVRRAKVTDGVPIGTWGVDFLYVGSEGKRRFWTLHGEKQYLEGVVDLALIGSNTRNLISSDAWNGVLDTDIAADDLLLYDSNGNLVAMVDVATDGLRSATGERWGEFSFSFPSDSQLVIRISAIRDLENSLAKKTNPVEIPLGTRERDTLLKLLIGMAVKGYSYDAGASKSKVPKEISDDLSDLNIGVSDDTVRKYLKQAADIFLPKSQK